MKPRNIIITLIATLVVTTLLFQSCKKDEEKENKFPTCEITAPYNGQEFRKGDTITISVEANDSDGNITEVRFAIDGVGKGTANINPFNYNWTTSNENIGSHIIKVSCIDNGSGRAFDEIIVVLTENGSSNTPPKALFAVCPCSGTTSTNFAFDASGSIDNEDSTSKLQIRWDFDGNGSWDTDWDYDKTTNHQYVSENTYQAKLEVKDSEGLSDQYTKSITVSNDGIPGTFIDPRDGQIYQTVKIGSQTWFSENLNYETCNSWWYDNSSAYGDIYGRLYTWDAALIACPSGWHLPSDDEWKTLEMALGLNQSEVDDTDWRGIDEGKKMKSTSGWGNNGNGTNSSGFNALPGGGHHSSGFFFGLGSYGNWWSATEGSSANVWKRSLHYIYDQVYRDGSSKSFGYSVRCLKD